MDRTLKTIIFSKDRAAQLDALLRSIELYYPECDKTVIYTASTDEYQTGYVRLFNMWPNLDIRKQSDFKQDVLSLIGEGDIMFLVDDMQFINRFGYDKVYKYFMEYDDILTYSLRMYPGIFYSYTKDLVVMPPFEDEGEVIYIWDWTGCTSYWGYPMSMDGHIFRASDLKPMIEKIEFDNPNKLEYELARLPISKKFMICSHEPKVVNYPTNRVQDTFKNRSMDLCPIDMNKRFLKGGRIKLMQPIRHISCHVEQEPEWE